MPSAIPKTPIIPHRYHVIAIGNNGYNHFGINWLDKADDFAYADAHDLHKFLRAPAKKAFLIYSVHLYVSTIHITQADDGVQMSTCNLDMNLDSVRYGHFGQNSAPRQSRRIAHTRIYYNKIGLNGLVHDANADGDYDAATDHRNPFSVSDWRHYDPDPHWIYPHGIYAGHQLVFVCAHGSAQNMSDYSPSSTSFFCHIEYSLVDRKEYDSIMRFN